MTFDEYATMVRSLHTLNTKQQEYIDRIPRDIRDAIFDNEYTAAYSEMLNSVMKAALPQNLYDDTQWLLYEWKPGALVQIDGVDYVTCTLDECLQLSKMLYF